MRNQDVVKLKKFSVTVGDFIRLWGFRKIHGEIWVVIYLIKRPLSGAEIVKLLGVSKALVSPALRELEAEGLVQQVKSENSKTKRYQAIEDVESVIRKVLNRREKPMIAKIHSRFQELNAGPITYGNIDSSRLAKVGSMITSAQMFLSLLSDPDQTWN